MWVSHTIFIIVIIVSCSSAEHTFLLDFSVGTQRVRRGFSKERHQWSLEFLQGEVPKKVILFYLTSCHTDSILTTSKQTRLQNYKEDIGQFCVFLVWESRMSFAKAINSDQRLGSLNSFPVDPSAYWCVHKPAVSYTFHYYTLINAQLPQTSFI